MNPFIENEERFKILLLLVLTELNEDASALRFRTAILSSIFQTRSTLEEDETQSIGVYFQMIGRVKKLYLEAKMFFDTFAKN